MGSFLSSVRNSVETGGVAQGWTSFLSQTDSKFSQAANLNRNLNDAYKNLLAQKPGDPADITDPAVQAAYRAQALKTQSQAGRSSTFMPTLGKSFLGG